MNKISVIKKVKANLIRLRVHKILGWADELLIYTGYMIKLSRWAHQNKSKLKYNDFYNRKVRHADRFNLYDNIKTDYALDTTPFNYLEFGVGRGNSLRWWSEANNNPETKYYAFDTYEGLPEKYGTYEAGVFDQGGNYPKIDDERIDFVKGLFQDTLLGKIPEVDFSRRNYVHVDGDLYSSAVYCLTMLYPYLKKGDLIVFDEFGVPSHEFKAFLDFIKTFYIKLTPVGAINNYLQVVFEVEEVKNLNSQK